jgi:hypothetical protein
MKKFIFILLLFVFISGCGYTTRGFVYKESKIHIPAVVNQINITSEDRRYAGYRSYPILLEKILTNVLINKFNIDGHLKVVKSEEGALKLSCAINDYQREALRYTDSEDIKEQRLRLSVHIKLTDSSGQTLKEKDVVGETSFFLVGTNRKTESAAQQDLVDDTARRILEAVIEEW